MQTDVSKREVRFDLKDRSAFDVAAVTKALNGQGFPDVKLKSGPP